MDALEGPELPSLDVGPPSRKAVSTAETLLEAYYRQDSREAFLLQGNVQKAEKAQRRAIDCMSSTYADEFPTIAASRAELAGEKFMRALFLQDEIENWPMLLGTPNRDRIAPLLQSDFSERYGRDGSSDPRWADVKDHLLETCDLTGIDEAYAEKQTQFWRLHGQLEEYWEQVAIEAHTIKLESMLPDHSASLAKALGEYFVAGVKIHDEWEHRNREADIGLLVQQVATYYQKMFDVRADGDR